MSDRYAVRIRRVLAVVVGVSSAFFSMLLNEPFVRACCAGLPPHTQGALVEIVFLVFFFAGACVANVVAAYRDRWPSYVLASFGPVLGTLGIAFSAVDSGDVNVAENVLLGVGVIIVTWAAHIIAQVVHRAVRRLE